MTWDMADKRTFRAPPNFKCSGPPSAAADYRRWASGRHPTREDLDRLWADPKNWDIVYRCANDPRIIVPRRRRWMGWTINFAHSFAWPALVLCAAVAVGPALALLPFGILSVPQLIAALVASVAVLVGISHWEASRSRE